MDAQNRLDPQWLAKLDDVVREAQKAGLDVILDEHDFDVCSEDVAACRTKLTAFWSQVAPRFANAPRNVAFELLNEPHAKLDGPTWNALFAELLAIVRQIQPDAHRRHRSDRWNSLKELPNLKLPNDPNLLVTFHYYEPFNFTHQGATWAGDEVKKPAWGELGHRGRPRGAPRRLRQGHRLAKANNRPILLGEFGAYDKSGTPLDLRVASSRQSAARPSATASAGPTGSSRRLRGLGHAEPALDRADQEGAGSQRRGGTRAEIRFPCQSSARYRHAGVRLHDRLHRSVGAVIETLDRHRPPADRAILVADYERGIVQE